MSETPRTKIEHDLPEAKVPDFGADIDLAIKNAPLIDFTPGSKNSKQRLGELTDSLTPLKELPDSAELAVHYTREPNCVSTHSLRHYRTLLEQTWEHIPTSRTPEETADLIADDFEHEAQHGAALEAVAPYASPHYGVAFSRTMLPGEEEPSLVAVPFCAAEGTMLKIDLATMYAGPSKLDENDEHALKSMGYGSAAEVAERRAALEAAGAAQHAKIGELAVKPPEPPHSA